MIFTFVLRCCICVLFIRVLHKKTTHFAVNRTFQSMCVFLVVYLICAKFQFVNNNTEGVISNDSLEVPVSCKLIVRPSCYIFRRVKMAYTYLCVLIHSLELACSMWRPLVYVLTVQFSCI